MSDSPVSGDIRYDDHEFNPKLEPRRSHAWLNLLNESEEAFEPWNTHCDRIDKLYGNLDRLANVGRDKEFAMFWANVEVIKPSIYATPPKPAISEKFHDRRPVLQAAAEVMERCCEVAFDLGYIDALMLQIRDDVAMNGRGVAWCRYEGKGGKGYYDHEKVCFDFKHRRDFLHSVSRCWYEVEWVAAASYLTREKARERFHEYSGNEYQDADYRVDRESREVGGADNRERAKFWEIWHKPTRRVVWVSEGCENILDEADPHLELQGFFPCPKPAYGCLQRGSLVPVPDVMQYRDQLEELNLLTAKIHALSMALEAKGFYPSGGAELGDAIQAAMMAQTPGRMLIPIANWAQFGGSKEVIIWMPIAEIAGVIQTCTALRKEIIQDIYQIMGLSDIMRGATDPRETLGAQNLKSQYGSSRIRDKQFEMVRLARDLVCITSEIITEKFDPVTIIEMCQTQLPTDDMKRQQVMQLQQQLGNQQMAMQMAQQQPQFQQAAQQQPDLVAKVQQEGQKLIEEGKRTIEQIMGKPTIDQVLHLFKNQRTKSFALDIETDSTIMIDENTEKQRRSEFVGVLSQLLPQLAQMISAEPLTAPFCGEVLKFATAPFRAARTMDAAINDLVDVMKQKAGQPRGDDPATMQAKTAKEIEKMKVDAQKERDQAEIQLKAAELTQKDTHEKMKLQSQQQIEMMKMRADQQDDEARAQHTNLKAMADREKHQAQMIKAGTDMQLTRQKGDLAMQASRMKQQDMLARQGERQAMQQFRQTNQGGIMPT